MNRLGVVLSSCAALLLPVLAQAQEASLEICNNGHRQIVVAVAARIQTFITGYRWRTEGWYAVSAGQCTTVYSEDYDAAGPYTPQSGARLVFTVVRSDGVRGAYQSSQVQQSGWMRSGTGQICVNGTDAFKFEEAAGDPAANCDGVLMPVAHDFMPNGPGTFTYTTDWDGYGSFVPLKEGGQSKSSVANSGASDSVDNSFGAQFIRALVQAGKDASDKPANADTAATAARSRAAMLQWVREDLAAYLDASKTGFEAYKSGEAQLSQGYRTWTSSSKPALANGCWVIQGDTTSTFSCAIPLNKNTERAYYTEFTDDVTASLPADWSRVDGAPFGGQLPSIGYRSSSGAHGEVWLVEAPDGGYQLNYQLVSAPTAAHLAKASDDDPLGSAGFVKPSSPEAPAATREESLLQSVHEHVAAYIEAANTRFEGYKSGEPQVESESSVWASSEQPSLARGCYVAQMDSMSAFSCVMAVSKDSARSYFAQLSQAVAASLPADWKRAPGSLLTHKPPCIGWLSPSDEQGEIWLETTKDGEYELRFQLATAYGAPEPSKPFPDDPIGEGGFITPPTPAKPPE